MFGFLRKSVRRELSPQQLQNMLNERAAIVVDVREVAEFADGHIPSALNMPLSSFNPSALPSVADKIVVLSCAGGRRSATALDRCAQANAHIDTHLAGGLSAWKAARLPIAK